MYICNNNNVNNIKKKLTIKRDYLTRNHIDKNRKHNTHHRPRLGSNHVISFGCIS